MNGFDPEILQDFLTEATELLDELEGDLVSLEHAPADPELLNKVFRALHTIKGSASFLALTALVAVAHAAESSLNAARNGEVLVTKPMMDLLLETTDVLKVQFTELAAGNDLTPARPELIAVLARIGEGNQIESFDAAAVLEEEAATSASQTSEPSSAPATMAQAGAEEGSRPGSAVAFAAPPPVSAITLELPPGKADLVEFFADDLIDTLAAIEEQVGRLAGDTQAVLHDLVETTDQLKRSAEFFEVKSMVRLTQAIAQFSELCEDQDADTMAQAMPRLRAVLRVLSWQAEGIKQSEAREWSTENLLARLAAALNHEIIPDDARLTDESDLAALAIDGVIDRELFESITTQVAAEINGIAELADRAASAAAPDGPAATGAGVPAGQAESRPATQVASPTAGPTAGPTATPPGSPTASADRRPSPAAMEQTIRVEVGRLESLMNLVGELVLQKNRISALTRRVQSVPGIEQELREAIGLSSADLDRVTGDMQMAVMRTRMQPLDKLFGKYPRLIRDLSGKTGKKIELVIEGGDTEVDKSVLEELGDPMVHLMRNSADHGVEMPAERLAAGKSETGTITISAAHAGSNVVVRIADNGRGLTREKIGAKAVANGLVSEAELETLSDRDVYRFILAPGFSTAEQVSDLSGRGVGMDVVSTNISRLGGSLDIDSVPGNGTIIDIIIPLTVAIMPAMMVGVEDEIYAVPLDVIHEIVDTDQTRCSSVGGRAVMRLRGAVLPIVDGRDAFNTPGDRATAPKYAMVLSQNDKSVGLLVSRVIGQQEIVIKPLGDLTKSGPISGATVRDDGGVSLIVDVGMLLRTCR